MLLDRRSLRVAGFSAGAVAVQPRTSHPPARRQTKVNKSTLRVTLATVVASVVAAGPVAAGSAQAATLPTISIAINSSSATVSGTLESGAVNVVLTDTGVKEGAVI